MTSPSTSPQSSEYKFPAQATIRHIKSGKVYRVLGLPDVFRLEANDEPAYAYMEVDTGKRLVWVRGQTDMEEDGRFEIIHVPPQMRSTQGG